MEIGSLFFFCRYLQGTIFVVVEHNGQLVSSPLATPCVQVQLITELPLKNCREEGRTEREGDAWQNKRILGDVQVGLVGAEWDER